MTAPRGEITIYGSEMFRSVAPELGRSLSLDNLRGCVEIFIHFGARQLANACCDPRDVKVWFGHLDWIEVGGAAFTLHPSEVEAMCCFVLRIGGQVMRRG